MRFLLLLLLAVPLLGQEVAGFDLPSPAYSVVSTENSTTTALASSGVFTGAWEYVSYPSVMVTGKSDQDGTLCMDFSPDGVNADSTIGGSSCLPEFASVPFFHEAEVGGRYFRVRFTNRSASDQTYLRLNTAYGQFGKLTANLGGTISQFADTIVTRPLPWNIPLTLGLASGYEARWKFGTNPEIDNSAATYPEDVQVAGGSYTGQPATCAGETGTILSSDVNDAAGDTGLRTIEVYYLDDDFVEHTETLNMNGATGVATTYNVCRAFRMRGKTAGASATNEGTITLRNTTTSANVFATIPAGEGQTSFAHFTVPAGKTAIVSQLETTITRASGASGSAIISMYARRPGEIYVEARKYNFQEGTHIIPYAGFSFPEKTDVKYTVEFVSDNDTSVTVETEYTLVRNN